MSRENGREGVLDEVLLRLPVDGRVSLRGHL